MSVSYAITGGLTHLSGNPIQITLTASAAKTNHKLLLKVTCKTMGGVDLVGSPFIEEIMPKNLVAVFDISGIVDYPAEYGFTYPIGGACGPHDLLATKVTFEVGESWTDSNGDYQEEFTPASETLKVLKGKLRQYELGLLNEANKSFASEYIEGGRFLTHQSDYQKVSPQQICMLWYLGRWTDSHAITLNLKVVTDKREYLITQAHTIWDITGLIELEFSGPFWGVYDNPAWQWGEKLLTYEFWISDGNAPGGADVSERRHYVIDNTFYEHNEFVYAVNPLSGIDQYWFTGEVKEGVTTTSETAVRPVPVGAGTQAPSIRTISINGYRTWEINTGWRSKDEMLALRDLLESRDTWIVDKTANKLLPVIIEAGDFTLYDSTQDIQNLAIKLKEAHNG